jgi:hypothetical protein
MNPDLLTAIIGALGGIVAAAIAVLPQLRKTNARIDTLFFYTMSGPMYGNLKKLADGTFMDYEMSDGLKRELYHLRDTGFIEITDRSQRSIRKIPSRDGADVRSDLFVSEPQNGVEEILFVLAQNRKGMRHREFRCPTRLAYCCSLTGSSTGASSSVGS